MSEKNEDIQVNEAPESTIFSDPAHFSEQSDTKKRGNRRLLTRVLACVLAVGILAGATALASSMMGQTPEWLLECAIFSYEPESYYSGMPYEEMLTLMEPHFEETLAILDNEKLINDELIPALNEAYTALRDGYGDLYNDEKSMDETVAHRSSWMVGVDRMQDLISTWNGLREAELPKLSCYELYDYNLGYFGGDLDSLLETFETDLASLK